MCANCRHTGCWIFLGLLYLVTFLADGQTVYPAMTSGTNSHEISLGTLSMQSPEVQQAIKETGSVSPIFMSSNFQTITEEDLAAYVSGKNASGSSISFQTLYDFISTFHDSVSNLVYFQSMPFYCPLIYLCWFTFQEVTEEPGHTGESGSSAFSVKPVGKLWRPIRF